MLNITMREDGQMTKLCSNCKWSKQIMVDEDFTEYECKSPQNVEVSLIDGSLRPIYWMCEAHRNSDRFGCTVDGLFYEEK